MMKTFDVWSDRLYEENPEKFNRCLETVWGNHSRDFGRRSIKDIERFLSLYFEGEVKVLKVSYGENASNGYPYWRFTIR